MQADLKIFIICTCKTQLVEVDFLLGNALITQYVLYRMMYLNYRCLLLGPNEMFPRLLNVTVCTLDRFITD
jgi:hypothetical protein